ncbi:uncharacterized protein LOC6735534 [Drosophila simulans]|uniref:GD25206 n=1 Tax=Drosophila simulans TaxID=7240 RepID=B4QG19_DROSI|nr:uncharacterized protein LOC6735534 [Drosophila simulans]EDX08055.1 GD25206 [Drosophila simulans]KMY95523.1 uncharacterized protein Dsimw501_GD25206 [Drosophila simulans]
MSIVLDVIQQVVLQKAYDLTCEAAILALRKCGKLKIEDGKSKPKREKPLPPVKPIAQEVVSPMKAPEANTIPKYTGRDMPRKNFGSIDPPQCSCMRVCRDSYFS